MADESSFQEADVGSDESLPDAAVGLIKWLDTRYPALDALPVLRRISDEALRLELAADLGRRTLIDELKQRYKLQ